MESRAQRAAAVRRAAADVAARRPHPRHIANGEEVRYRDPNGEPTHIANFTKGLPHDPKTGLIRSAEDYELFVTGIESGSPADFARTPLGPAIANPEGPGTGFVEHNGCPSTAKIGCGSPPNETTWESALAHSGAAAIASDFDPDHAPCDPVSVRAWESAGAGHLFDLEGPDAQAVTMPPAPILDSSELRVEVAEVYLQALLRDVHFSQLRTSGKSKHADQCATESTCQPALTTQEAIDILSALGAEYYDESNPNTAAERARHRGAPTLQSVFRGTTPGDAVGPYLSQFLLIGNTGLGNAAAIGDGQLQYGATRVPQQVRIAEPCRDYMTTFEAFVDVQNGADLRGVEAYQDGYRFPTTPRDLATYVHYDALYQAYLNACLWLSSSGAPLDRGLPFHRSDAFDKQQGFAHFGGPHILSLVCEVATRALKAVRYQKFNIHRRLRPEAVGGLIDARKRFPNLDSLAPVDPLIAGLGTDLLDRVKQHNAQQNATHKDRIGDATAGSDCYLLPMAFPEGSPMHPSYGAGHATVAGACVTVLKAFFDHGHPLTETVGGATRPVCYEPNADGSALTSLPLDQPLTVEGELNKLASNIAIGRNWAGVHYHTDYIESLRMGEQIALGILEEQRLTYGEVFSMTVPLFDGGAVRI